MDLVGVLYALLYTAKAVTPDPVLRSDRTGPDHRIRIRIRSDGPGSRIRP